MSIRYKIIPSNILTQLPLWPSLYKLINDAYEPTRDDWPMPQPYYRLHPDIMQAAEQLLKELGEHGVMCVALLTSDENNGEGEGNTGEYGGGSIACAAIMEFEGDVNDVKRAVEGGISAAENLTLPDHTADGNGNPKVPAWEFNYVSTSRAHQGKGVAQNIIRLLEEQAVKKEGKAHMIARTIEEISGPFWRKRGYNTLEDSWITLPKGFTHLEGYNGLPRDLILWTGDKWLG